MVLRSFLNQILAFIGSASLSDEEFFPFPTVEPDYTVEVYEGLLAVLQARETVSTQADRLKSYFLAKGVNVTGDAYTPRSNILIGRPL